jgi:CRISPR-associated endonuclease/helicase Cas3
MIGGRSGPKRDYSEKPLLFTVYNCLAKTEKDAPGMNVLLHGILTGWVTRELIKIFPAEMQHQLFPEGTDLITACHDVGKISPCFQKLLYSQLQGYEDLKEALSLWDETHASRDAIAFHGSVSQVCLESLWGSEIGKVVGLHHGFTPNVGYLSDDTHIDLYGGPLWARLRREFIRYVTDHFDYPEDFSPCLHNSYQAGVIAGLVTVADWIASGAFFDGKTIDITNKNELACFAKHAVESAGFRGISYKRDLDFANIFSFQWNTLQKELQEIVQPQGGVYILEAPMGMGKTEAALYVAYTLLQTHKVRGIYFALPTRLTSDKIYERVLQFTEKIVSDGNGVTTLLHSTAWLYQTELGADAAPGASWFTTAKRGILAPFAVGTIDQALMAVLNVRHNFVRYFGLAGKLVILDEVHSYDTFTGTIIKRLIAELVGLHCTVIILSATLTEQQKRELLAELVQAEPQTSSAYPLITAINRLDGQGFKKQEKPFEVMEHRKVVVHYETDQNRLITEAITRARNGYQVLWIENTVAEAQEIYSSILNTYSTADTIPCGLLHSRFTLIDRSNKERIWISRFGKTGFGERQKSGSILVGTQVLEQSLDIDADFLITRLCPSDMLFQRVGRLWRHNSLQDARPDGSHPEVRIIGPEKEQIMKDEHAFGPSGYVYSPYVLYRSFECWSERQVITIPDDIRSLLEATYEERHETNHIIQKYQQELHRMKEQLSSLAYVGLSKNLQTLPETRAQTRYGEQDSVHVLILTGFHQYNNGVRLTFNDQSIKDIGNNTAISKQERKEIAAHILEHCVPVSERYAPQWSETIGILKDYVYIGDAEEQPFRIALLGRDGSITGLRGEPAHTQYELFYNSLLGYSYKRRRQYE